MNPKFGEKKLAIYTQTYCITFVDAISGYLLVLYAHSLVYLSVISVIVLSPTGSWTAATSDSEPWIMAEWDELVLVTGIGIQGSADNTEWIESFSLEYSADGSIWKTLTRDGLTAEFQGSYDGNTEVYVGMPGNMQALYVRFNVLSWHSAASLRWQIYGCAEHYRGNHM